MWENVNVFSDTQSVQFAPDAYFYLLYFSRIIQSVFGISLCSKCASCDFSVQWRCVINIVQAVGSFPASTRIFPSSGNLTVVNLSPEDDGVYECVAASVVSSVITTTLLIIESTYPVHLRPYDACFHLLLVSVIPFEIYSRRTHSSNLCGSGYCPQFALFVLHQITNFFVLFLFCFFSFCVCIISLSVRQSCYFTNINY